MIGAYSVSCIGYGNFYSLPVLAIRRNAYPCSKLNKTSRIGSIYGIDDYIEKYALKLTLIQSPYGKPYSRIKANLYSLYQGLIGYQPYGLFY